MPRPTRKIQLIEPIIENIKIVFIFKFLNKVTYELNLIIKMNINIKMIQII